MPTPTRGAWRRVRAALLTVTTLGLAVAAHAAGGGHLPTWWALVALAVPTTCVGVLVTARRLSGPVVLGVLGGGQLLLHLGLSALATGHCGTLVANHHDVVVGACTAGEPHTTNAWMLTTHVVATLLTAVLLARGEQALWAVLDRLAPLVVALVLPVPPVRIRLRQWENPVVPRPRSAVAVVPVRRGPPV